MADEGGLGGTGDCGYTGPGPNMGNRKKRGRADYISAIDQLREGAEETEKLLPEPTDRLGQRIYGSTQFGGGNDPFGNTRVYPGLPFGGYHMTYDQIAKANRYGDNAGTWLAAGGGVMGRGTASAMNAARGKLGGYRDAISRITGEAEQNGALTPEVMSTAEKFKALLDMLKRNGG